MRITIVIDDDVVDAAGKIAAIVKKSIGEVLSALARRALSSAKSDVKTRNGVPVLKIRKRLIPVTSELVHSLREELS